MRIAIIGGGISGLVSAHLLHGDHDITLFEANGYIGGHTHTIDVEREGKRFGVDTGFIVFNEKTYPNFLKLITKLGVAYQPSKMTFSLKSEPEGKEYSAHNLNTIFGQRRNLFDPSFYAMVRDILRLRGEFSRLIKELGEEKPLVPYLLSRAYSKRFIDFFLIPMAAAIWSADPVSAERFPLQTFARFFLNHGILEVKNPFEWKVISGGSARYVEKITASFRDRIRLSAPIRSVTRRPDHIEVFPVSGPAERFDHVVLACHSDQALALLADPTPQEREVLGAIPYRDNLAVLHTDASVLPERRNLWASWNYLIPRTGPGRAVLTYDMNILQSLKSTEEFCVTLNLTSGIEERKKIGTYLYHHPQYSMAAPAAQARHSEISGQNRTHYCGAYWGYGFHEDGVKSALAACKYFGKSL
ncbi:MAG TPA: FAD-dependent oxidoreductase [Nitrospirota bacterium]|nr:FAD-dependent oxidoreductase [Nitrospirota bacterium]